MFRFFCDLDLGLFVPARLGMKQEVKMINFIFVIDFAFVIDLNI